METRGYERYLFTGKPAGREEQRRGENLFDPMKLSFERARIKHNRYIRIFAAVLKYQIPGTLGAPSVLERSVFHKGPRVRGR